MGFYHHIQLLATITMKNLQAIKLSNDPFLRILNFTALRAWGGKGRNIYPKEVTTEDDRKCISYCHDRLPCFGRLVRGHVSSPARGRVTGPPIIPARKFSHAHLSCEAILRVVLSTPGARARCKAHAHGKNKTKKHWH